MWFDWRLVPAALLAASGLALALAGAAASLLLLCGVGRGGVTYLQTLGLLGVGVGLCVLSLLLAWWCRHNPDALT